MLNVRDLYYLKQASFDLIKFYQVVSISNCPNLEVLSSKNIIRLPSLTSMTTISPIKQLRELHYDIP
jgi:hypothetical protein